jgi:hypothetical protein
MADTAIHPAVSAAATVLKFAKGTFGELEVSETAQALIENVQAVKDGNLSGPEAMLVSQAHSLNAIFTELVRWLIFSLTSGVIASLLLWLIFSRS